jgi:hypothetical protein
MEEDRLQAILDGKKPYRKNHPEEVKAYQKRMQGINDGKIRPNNRDKDEMLLERYRHREERPPVPKKNPMKELSLEPLEDDDEIPTKENPMKDDDGFSSSSSSSDSFFDSCVVCEKVGPLFHCAECMDSAYCSQRCQVEGCGYKH